MKNNSKTILYLSIFWLSLLLLIGIWWIYLFFHFSSGKLPPENLRRMIAWEGTFFMITLIGLSVVLFWLYYRDVVKTKALANFFSALTHELKTPLASIRLQSEVVAMTLEKFPFQEGKLSEMPNELRLIVSSLYRLVEDGQNLENQLDKVLQLSRLERSGHLEVSPVDLFRITDAVVSKCSQGLTIRVDGTPGMIVSADSFAWEIIIRNLLENTRNHSAKPEASIKFIKDQNNLIFKYQDYGDFKGESEKLTTLFYKSKSNRGSGIGLYLVSKIVTAFKGSISFPEKNPFTIQIILPLTSNYSSDTSASEEGSRG